MSKYTTTLIEIIQSELIFQGKNEFFDGYHMTLFNDEASFIKKTMFYDADVQQVVDKKFFLDFKLQDSVFDLHFKRSFINRFLHREIKYQTLEVFASQLYYYMQTHSQYINELYNSYLDYAHTHSESSTNSSSTDNSVGNNENNYREANQTLPQDEINLDLNNDTFNYADDNKISKNKNTSTDEKESNSESISQSDLFNIDSFLKTKDLYEQIFKDIDKVCFLQIW